MKTDILVLPATTTPCLICGTPVQYTPEYCCDGSMCGCQGQPVWPCVCSERCYCALMNGIGKPYEQRRMDAGIERVRS